MARHRKMEVAEDADPKMDISSLIDCCFLLLLYFIVCTSLVQERKLDMNMPGPPPPSPPTNRTPLEPGLVKVEANGSIYWGSASGEQLLIDSDMDSHELPVLVDSLIEFKNKAESTGNKPIVQFRVDGSVPHQRVIDVLNAFSRAGIDTVGLANVEDEF